MSEKIDTMKDGTEVKAIYIKNLSLSDWETLKMVARNLGNKTVAETVRFCIRKVGGRL